MGFLGSATLHTIPRSSAIDTSNNGHIRDQTPQETSHTTPSATPCQTPPCHIRDQVPRSPTPRLQVRTPTAKTCKNYLGKMQCNQYQSIPHAKVRSKTTFTPLWRAQSTRGSKLHSGAQQKEAVFTSSTPQSRDLAKQACGEHRDDILEDTLITL